MLNYEEGNREHIKVMLRRGYYNHFKADSFENKEDMLCVKLDVTETDVC